jgi:hypothetical protein
MAEHSFNEPLTFEVLRSGMKKRPWRVFAVDPASGHVALDLGVFATKEEAEADAEAMRLSRASQTSV